jgi:hypothetical protein
VYDNVLGEAPKKKILKSNKVKCFQEKLFNALIPVTTEKISRETIIEREMNYNYQRMDTQDISS